MSDELLLYGAAAAVRLLLPTVFPALPDLLSGRVEVSTPVTSFKRCTHNQYNQRMMQNAYKRIVQEGVFLYTHNVSPYDGGVYHQAPLLLPLFALLPNSTSYPIATSVLYTLVDLLSAYAIGQIANSGQNVVTRLFTSSRKNSRWSSLAITAG
jgi:phosphatidylinositol glycan class U